MEVVGDMKEEPVLVGLQREMSTGKAAKRRGGGDLERTQRKRARSLGETVSSTKMVDVVRESVAAAGTAGGKTSGGKRKRSKVAVEAVEIAAQVAEVAEPGYDSEHVINAAQALFELFGGGSSAREERPPSTTSKQTQDVKWAGKKCRSSRSSRKMEDESINNSISKLVSSSGATSATVTDNPEVSESSGSQNPSIGVSPAVHPEEEEEEAVNRAEEDSEAEGRSVILNPYVGLELGLGLSLGQSREHKLLSQSSLESTFPNSRVESPSSPLPTAGPDSVLTPKLEEELMAQFGFPRTIAIRPVKNASNARKSKVSVGWLVWACWKMLLFFNVILCCFVW